MNLKAILGTTAHNSYGGFTLNLPWPPYTICVASPKVLKAKKADVTVAGGLAKTQPHINAA
jgi:hypothetical protein